MYYVDESVTIKDLVSINNTQKNWSMTDYIHYYSSLGNRSYMNLESMCRKYDEIPLKAILAALNKGTFVHERTIKNGDIKFTDEEFIEAEEALEFVRNLKKDIKMKIPMIGMFFFLVVKTYYLEGIDRNRLYQNIVSRYGTEKYGNSDQCAAALEHWYNFKSRSSYRYISNELLPRR